jgi:nucleoid-associated protein YgaU
MNDSPGFFDFENRKARRRNSAPGSCSIDKRFQEVFMSEEMPDFSNVQSGSSSTAVKIYEVVAGDSLSKIARREYGNANEWKRIFEANRDVLKDPDKIFPGQKLKIPPK